MIARVQYAPGPASGAEVRKDGEKWTLVLVRELRHSPAKVWQAISTRTCGLWGNTVNSGTSKTLIHGIG